MSDRILMICCSKNRPDRIQEMIKSYQQTKKSEETSMVYCLDSDEKRMEEYIKVLDGSVVIIEHPNYQTPVFNLVSKQMFPDFDYYGLINDDHIFRTEGWDVELVKTIKEKGDGFGLAHANALWYDSDILCKHPSAFIISANIIKALEYAIYPELRHFKLDAYFRDLVDPLGLQFYREDIVIEHMHFHVGKAENDENYEWGYSSEEMTWGTNKYAKWLLMFAERDRNRITKAIERSKKIQSNET